VSATPPTYDLVLLLDPQAEPDVREKILGDARAMIGESEITHSESWGERALAYPIAKKKSAEYHLIQFHASNASVLEELGRTLRITDGVVRYRVIKLRAGVGAPPPMPAAEPPREEAAVAQPSGAQEAEAEVVDDEPAAPEAEEADAVPADAPEPEPAAEGAEA